MTGLDRYHEQDAQGSSGVPETSLTELERQVRSARASIEKFTLTTLFPKLRDAEFRRTRHAREWFQLPMSYVRVMEVPLTLALLEPQAGMRVLDISSPKLLALYLACNGFTDLIASDLEEYFTSDFRTFNRIFRLDMDVQVFDARAIPLPEASVDRVFSISVFEHIPGGGDQEAVREAARVLRPGGVFVLTVPASAEYLEEWIREKGLYWRSDTRDDGALFYQRRYSRAAVDERLWSPGFVLDEIVCIAERPIRAPALGPNGMLLHNAHYLERLWLTKAANRCARLKLPLLRYAAHRALSQRAHYLTRDYRDPNVRQVALRLRKPLSNDGALSRLAGSTGGQSQ